MAEKNIIMQRKNEDGTYDIYYPKTKVENVEGAVKQSDFASHKNEIATQEQLGHVKAGQNITIDSDGTINAKGGNVDSVNGKTGEVVIDVKDIAGLNSDGVIIGQGAGGGDDGAIAIGYYAEAQARKSVVIGQYATATGSSSVVVGPDAITYRYSVAIGEDAQAVGATSAVCIGSGSRAETYAIALGPGAEANGLTSIAIGYFVEALNKQEGVLGGDASNTEINWKVPGNFTVSGTKNFEIPHPKPEKKATHIIRHSSVESPTPGDTLYRWRVQASKDNDLVTIDLPDYFVWLNTNVQIFVTPQGHFGNGYGDLNRETEQLEIHCQFAGEYNVLVIGTRNDDHQSVKDWDIKGVEREIGESWTGETYVFEVDEIMEVEEIKEVSA